MAPKALQNIAGHKKWDVFSKLAPPPISKSGGFNPQDTSPCSAAPVTRLVGKMTLHMASWPFGELTCR